LWRVSRQQWCSLSDQITKFFHFIAKRRGRKKFIMEFRHANRIHRTPSEIKSAASSYFTNLFSRPNMRRAVIRDMGFRRLSTGQSAFSERPITLDEVHEAVWDCDRAKSPGPDGFNFRFTGKSGTLSVMICFPL